MKKYVLTLTADGRPDQAPPTLPDNAIEVVYPGKSRQWIAIYASGSGGSGSTGSQGRAAARSYFLRSPVW